MTTGPKRRPSRAERRVQLLDAAVDAIRAQGSGVSMEQIAAAGGVTKPILYRHFGDRNGLIEAVGAEYSGRLLERLTEALVDGSSPEQLLHSAVDGYLAFLEEDPELYTFLISQAGTGPVGATVNSLVETISRQVTMVIGDRIRALGGDAGAAEPWGFGIVGMVHQAGDWWMKTRTMSRRALSDYLTALLWRGFEGLASVATEPTDSAPRPVSG